MSQARKIRAVATWLVVAWMGAGVHGGVAHAADQKGQFALHGIGALSCADLEQTFSKDEAPARASLSSWLLGYISAVNRERSDTYDATVVQVPDALVNMVAGVCRTNSSARVESVTYSLLQAFNEAKLSAESPEMQLGVDGHRTVLREETLRSVQHALIAQSVLKGRADGVFDARTQAALHAFQQAQHLPDTGLPDPATIVRLLVEIPAQSHAASK